MTRSQEKVPSLNHINSNACYVCLLKIAKKEAVGLSAELSCHFYLGVTKLFKTALLKGMQLSFI